MRRHGELAPLVLVAKMGLGMYCIREMTFIQLALKYDTRSRKPNPPKAV
jgi:hypothetical protein